MRTDTYCSWNRDRDCRGTWPGLEWMVREDIESKSLVKEQLVPMWQLTGQPVRQRHPHTESILPWIHCWVGSRWRWVVGVSITFVSAALRWPSNASCDDSAYLSFSLSPSVPLWPENSVTVLAVNGQQIAGDWDQVEGVRFLLSQKSPQKNHTVVKIINNTELQETVAEAGW